MAGCLDMNIVPWLVRHAAYFITRCCRVRSCGRTSLQMMKGRKSLTELVPFEETVMFKIPKTSQAVGSFEERWESGVWIATFAKNKLDVETAGLPVQFQPPTDAPSVPWNVRILKGDVDKHGPTPGCPGCRAAAGGKSWRSALTADCRTRMEALDADRRGRQAETGFGQ